MAGDDDEAHHRNSEITRYKVTISGIQWIIMVPRNDNNGMYNDSKPSFRCLLR